MKKIRFDYSGALDYIREHEIKYFNTFVRSAHEMLHAKSGAGSEFLGWVDLPVEYDGREFERIKESAEKIRHDSDILVIIGIGGSYLGARASIEMLSHSFHNSLASRKRVSPEIYFAGNNISPRYLADLTDLFENRDISINVVSKSGTTTEPAIAFRILKKFMERKYGRENARKRIYATTDRSRGAMKKLADEEGYACFTIPDNIGGRYSVLTAVGLLPMAACGIDIGRVMDGALDAYELYNIADMENNDCYMYAGVRNILYRKNRTIEIMAGYEPSLHYFIEWWKQLFGESEGKDGKGIFPAGADFTTDLHSMGQYIQDGLRNMFETVLNVEKPVKDIVLEEDTEEDTDNADGLSFLAGKSLDYINKKAMQGTLLAHTDGGVPNLVLNIPEQNDYYFGSMAYFFEKACGMSGYLMGVNPFDQPGVEAYKRNMFALLNKPGFELERKKLESRFKAGRKL